MKRKRFSARRQALTGILVLALFSAFTGPAIGAEDSQMEPVPLEQGQTRSGTRAGTGEGLEITSLKVTEFTPGPAGTCDEQIEGVPMLCWNGDLVLRMDFRLTGNLKAGTQYTIEPSAAYAFNQNPGFKHSIVSSAGVEYGQLQYESGRHSGHSGLATLTLAAAAEQHVGITGYIAFSMKGNYSLDGGSSTGVRPLGLTVAGRYLPAGATYYIQGPQRGTSLFTAPKLGQDGKPTVVVAGGVVANRRPAGNAVTLTGKAPAGTAFTCAKDNKTGISATAYAAPGNAANRVVQPSAVDCTSSQVQVTVSGLSAVDDVVIRATATANQWDHEYTFPLAITVEDGYLRQDVLQKTLAYDYGALGGNFAFRKEVQQVEDTNKNGLLGDAGDTIIYGFQVENTGEIELSQIVFTDPLLEIVRKNCLTAPLPTGKVVQCQTPFAYEITSADAENGEVVNVATATVILPDGKDGPSREAQTETPTVVANPGLALIKSVERIEDMNQNGVVGDAGDTVFFSFEVTNTGNTDFARVDLEDTLLNIEGDLCVEELGIGQTAQCAGEYPYGVTMDDQAEGKFLNVAVARAVNPDGSAGPQATDEIEVPTVSPPPPVIPADDEPEPPSPQPPSPQPPSPQPEKIVKVPTKVTEPPAKVPAPTTKLAQTGSPFAVPLAVAVGISMLAGLVLLFVTRFFRR